MLREVEVEVARQDRCQDRQHFVVQDLIRATKSEQSYSLLSSARIETDKWLENSMLMMTLRSSRRPLTNATERRTDPRNH